MSLYPTENFYDPMGYWNNAQQLAIRAQPGEVEQPRDIDARFCQQCNHSNPQQELKP